MDVEKGAAGSSSSSEDEREVGGMGAVYVVWGVQRQYKVNMNLEKHQSHSQETGGQQVVDLECPQSFKGMAVNSAMVGLLG